MQGDDNRKTTFVVVDFKIRNKNNKNNKTYCFADSHKISFDAQYYLYVKDTSTISS